MQTIPTRTGNPLRVALKYATLVAAIGSWLGAGTALAAPANDNFADAIILPGSSGTQTGTNSIDATLEVGEPSLAGDITKTVWFKWTSPGSGDFTINTLGSRNAIPAEFDTVLGIYSGAALNALTPLGETPKDTTLQETMTIPVISGTTYYIQIGGYLNETATNLVLNWSFVARTFDANILTFGPGATVGPVVNNAAQISWTVLNGTNLTALPASFTLSPNATCDRVSGAPQDFSSPVVYRVTSFDGLVVNDYTVTVSFPPPYVAPTPPPVTAGMMVWLTADGVNTADPTQLDASGRVQQWNDLSGNNFHATNTTETQRPSYLFNGLNGKPALRFTESASSKLFLGDLSASFGITPPVDPSPIAVNRGTGGAGIDGTYANIPSRAVKGALVADRDTAVTFNGTNQYVRIPYSADLNPPQGQPWTAEIWAKSNVSGVLPPFSSGTPDNSANRRGWVLYFFNSDLSFRAYTNNGANTTINGVNGLTIPGVVNPNTWYHVAVTCDGTDFRIYLNGVEVGSTPTVGPNGTYVAGNTGTALGWRLDAGNYFNGTLDEAAFYTTALSSSRIKAHYDNGTNDPQRARSYDAEIGLDNPVAHYKLNEPAALEPGASVFAVAAPNNDGRYNLFGNRANDDRWVANSWTESSPGSFRNVRAAFGANGYAAWPQSGANVYVMESSAARYRFAINGNQNSVLSTTGDYNSGAGADWTIGDSAANNDQRLNGDIAELIIFNRVLTPLEAEQVGGYLAQKYGLSTNYPPLNLTATVSSPVNALAYADNAAVQASVTVTAGSLDGSTAPYTVEFWLNGTLKGSDTTPPYSFDLGILPLGSYEFYAKVIDSSLTPVTATSATNTFTVVPAVSTTTALSSAANPSTYGSGSITATVVAANAAPLTGGTVQFFDAGTPLGAPVPVNTTTGQATYNISLLGAGTRELTATYNGFDGRTPSTSPALSQVVQKAPLAVTAKNYFRATDMPNPASFPYKITGFVNGQTLATSGVTGLPVLTTAATTSSPAGTYPITCATGTLSSDNYSFTLVDSTLTVSDVANTFSVNFFVGPEWPYGGAAFNGNLEAQETLKVEAGMPAGLGDWFTADWHNYLVPWAPAGPQAPVTITSNRGSTASFRMIDCRNGWSYSGAPRTNLLGDGNGNMMDAHVNGTLDPDNGATNTFKMEMKDIPFPTYDVIFYMGSNVAQFGDGKGGIKLNNGNEREFTLKPGAFDGTFIEMVDATTQGNYLVFKGVTGATLEVQVYGKGPTGFNHLGPFGFQIRPTPTDYGTWAAGFPGANLTDPNADLDGDGWTNDKERLFGLDPTSGTSVNPFTTPFNSVTGQFSFTRRDNALTGKFTDIEISTDLLLWTVDAGAVLVDNGPNANGIETVNVTLSESLRSAPRLFMRVSQRDARVPLAENFEASNGGFTVLTTTGSPWAWGDPDSDGFGGDVFTGNGGSINCWGTNLGNMALSNPGYYLTETLTRLRSPEVDLTNISAASLSFAEAMDLDQFDSAVVNIIEANSDTIIAAAIYTATDTSTTQAIWAPANAGVPIAIPAAALGRKVRFEWVLDGKGTDYFGWYVDDITVTETAP